MSKKLLIIGLLLISIFLIDLNITKAITCTTLDGCLNQTDLVKPGNAEIGGGEFKLKILDWIKKIGGFLGLMAIGAIVWGSFMMVISTGEEEKVKKAKDMIKWAILGFLGIVLASSLIALIVNFMYNL